MDISWAALRLCPPCKARYEVLLLMVDKLLLYNLICASTRANLQVPESWALAGGLHYESFSPLSGRCNFL